MEAWPAKPAAQAAGLGRTPFFLICLAVTGPSRSTRNPCSWLQRAGSFVVAHGI